MSPIGYLDLASALVTLLVLVWILSSWRRRMVAAQRFALLSLLFLILFDNLSNTLEWSGVNTAVDELEDYFQLLLPVLWGLLFYDQLRAGVERALRTGSKRLRKERDRVQSIAETSPAGILMLNPAGGITYANRRAEQLLGLQRKEVFRRAYNDPQWHITGLEGEPFPDEELPFEQVMRTRQPVYDVRHAIEWPDGKRVMLSLNAAPIFNSQGQVESIVTTMEDITGRMQSERAMRIKDHAMASAISAIALADLEGNIFYANAAFLKLWKYADDSQVLGRHIACLWQDEQAAAEKLDSLMQAGAWSGELTALNQDGSQREVLVAAHIVADEDGSPICLFGSFVDISQRKQMEAALFAEKERAQVTLHSIGDAVITTDAQGVVEYLNPVAETLTGWQATEAVGHPLGEIFQIVHEETRLPLPDPVARCLQLGRVTGMVNHTVLISRQGQDHDINHSAAPIRDHAGEKLGAVLVFHDVTEARRLARQMAHAATHDALTGLVNRREFETRAERALVNAKRHGSQHALCYLDLDQFKVINDTAGHSAGDELLKQVAGLLRGLFRQRDTLARLGGDEFGLLLENCPLDKALVVANEVVARLGASLFTWGGHSFQIGASIGIVPLNAETYSIAQALSQADVACYTAKDFGRGRVHLYEAESSQSAQRHGELFQAVRLREAVEREQFRLYGQVIAPLKAAPLTAAPETGQPEGLHFEVLLRLEDEGGRLVLPGAFIPPAERYGLMAAIDRWVIRQALCSYARMFPGGEALVSINLSGNSLSDESLLDYVYSQLEAWGVELGAVCFEITETAAIHNLERAQHFLGAIRSRGGRVALDDFGSGLSSFRYLKSLPVDFIKIDGSFVRDLLVNESDLAMVAAINQIGHIMGMQTIAEHVANAEIAARLRELGVDYAQGYGIGLPVPIEQITNEISSRVDLKR